MRIAKLFLPGQYEDAYVYRGRLVALTENRQLRVYDLEKIVQEMEENEWKESIPAPTWLFSRNDWLVSQQFKSLVRNEDIKQAFLRFINRINGRTLDVVAQDDFLVTQKDLDLTDPMILDLLIYNGRMYVGATRGLYHLNIDWKVNGEVLIENSQKRHDARCMNISARSGTVNASCEDDGLFSLIDEFDWFKRGSERKTLKVANRSLNTAWVKQDLINYPSYDHPYMFRSKIGTQEAVGLERESKIVKDFNLQAFDLEYLLTEARTQRSIDTNDEIRYVYNSNNRLFVATRDDAFISLPIGFDKKHIGEEEQPLLKKGAKSQQIQGRIISLHPCKPGIVIETMKSVVIVPKKGGPSTRLLSTEAVQVRTFPKSKRFQNLVVIVVEDGLFLMSVFDETEIGQELIEEDHPF
jgi:hypothetical protein